MFFCCWLGSCPGLPEHHRLWKIHPSELCQTNKHWSVEAVQEKFVRPCNTCPVRPWNTGPVRPWSTVPVRPWNTGPGKLSKPYGSVQKLNKNKTVQFMQFTKKTESGGCSDQEFEKKKTHIGWLFHSYYHPLIPSLYIIYRPEYFCPSISNLSCLPVTDCSQPLLGALLSGFTIRFLFVRIVSETGRGENCH